MREVIGRTPIQPALTEARAQIETAGACRDCRRSWTGYGAGVEITQVQLQKVDPPAAVIESFRDVQRANTDAERMRNEAEAYRNDIVPRARGDAARIIAGGGGLRGRPGSPRRPAKRSASSACSTAYQAGQGRHHAAGCISKRCRRS